jgi:hypothetical protein
MRFTLLFSALFLYQRHGAIIDDDIRRSLVNRFPFGILYSEYDNGIYVLAVMNLHRHPDYWKNRK